MFPHCKVDERDISVFFSSVSVDAVRAILLRPGRLSLSGFMTLLAPAAADCLRAMRSRAEMTRRRHFGKTVRVYSPLYISSHCVNDCAYCGFRVGGGAERRCLTMDELLAEAAVIRRYGIRSLLLVSGEDPRSVDIDFLIEAARRLRDDFVYIGIEIYPMEEKDYRRLFKAGIHGLTLYQETYDRELYESLHRSGPKADYQKRLEFMENGAKAGFHNLGLGFLLGLYDWRIEAVSMAAHALWLRKRYWRSRLQFSFPRITPAVSGFNIPNPVSEPELEQMMLAFRIFFEEADIFISTRESAAFRAGIAANCATHISAGSKVAPGGYCAAERGETGQFTLNDDSDFDTVADAMRAIGLEVVYKDWDQIFASRISLPPPGHN